MGVVGKTGAGVVGKTGTGVLSTGVGGGKTQTQASLHPSQLPISKVRISPQTPISPQDSVDTGKTAQLPLSHLAARSRLLPNSPPVTKFGPSADFDLGSLLVFSYFHFSFRFLMYFERNKEMFWFKHIFLSIRNCRSMRYSLLKIS